MKLTNSLLSDLTTEYPNLRQQIYFKSSLTALARAMQDLVLTSEEQYLVIANFQAEKFFRFLEHRFDKIAQKNNHVYILGVPDSESSFTVNQSPYETIPLKATDTLAGERHLVIIGKQYTACLVVQEKLSVTDLQDWISVVDEAKRFEGIWTFEREIIYSAADWLLGIIANYCPHLKEKTQQARQLFLVNQDRDSKSSVTTQSTDLAIFTQRLVVYLQAGQYKLLKAYREIAKAQRKEYLINKIAIAQRSSLNPEEILETTLKELGQLFPNCRCLLYRLNPDDTEVKIEFEYVPLSMVSLKGQMWSIADNPLFIAAQAQKSTLAIDNVRSNSYLNNNLITKDKILRAGIHSWLMISIRYQGKFLGMMELHYGGRENWQWKSEDIDLLEAVANSSGAALTQAGAYNNLLELNNQLETLEEIQNNLIAIVGHELRTPLSTIRVCLESLITEPNMALEFKNVMLDTALADTERLEQLIENFLTLSRLESGNAYRNIESLTVDYALNLALKNIQNSLQIKTIPNMEVKLNSNLPSVLADVDGLVEVFTKLLDNACKFTPIDGKIIITAQIQKKVALSSAQMLEIVIADTGSGIEKEQLEIIFDRFRQSESYLRRSVSGMGLGLVICRKIIQGMKGKIWANSAGKLQGSQFHFTLPIDS